LAKSNQASAGRVRIIGGLWKRSVLRFPAAEELRPTPDRVRETLFNWLGQDLGGLACLDLFAGSGVLGFEAASRGAARVVLVERDIGALRAMSANAQRLSASSLEIVSGDSLAYLARTTERFDVVFLDPPFRQNVLPEVLGRLSQVLKSGSRVYVEAPVPIDAPIQAQGRWREMKRGRAGQVSFQLLEWNDDRSGLSGDV
jgi:16S rRNA (guanine(966)-N(2))-methyltransferase RsmD